MLHESISEHKRLREKEGKKKVLGTIMVSRAGKPLKLSIWISSQGGREWLALSAVTELTTHAHTHTLTHTHNDSSLTGKGSGVQLKHVYLYLKLTVAS